MNASQTLFTATRRRVESELWRKDCSITTATSEVRVQHLPAGLEEGAGELESYREIIAYARSRGCIPIYLARASGFSVHVHRASTNTNGHKPSGIRSPVCRLFRSLRPLFVPRSS